VPVSLVAVDIFQTKIIQAPWNAENKSDDEQNDGDQTALQVLSVGMVD
jgi:hypothetical protein